MKPDLIFLSFHLNSPIIKFLLPLMGIIAVIALCKGKLNISPERDLKLIKPSANAVAIWIAALAAWMLLTDFFLHWRGEFDFANWKTQPFYKSFFRILAVCFAGPIFEELIFRGVLFVKLNKRLDNPWITIVLLAAVWSCMHYDYSPAVIFVIFIEGILLGCALIKSRSLYVPILMHICWNLYAVW